LLPPSLHDRVLKIFHDSPEGGHLGVDRTTKKILETFYWPGLKKIVADYICRCLDCERFKTAKENTKALLQTITSKQPWELIEIDFIGPVNESTSGKKYILSVVDHFSKYAVTYATSRQDSKTVIECLTNLVAQYGVPQRILSDQGRSFVSKDFQNFCVAWNIKKSTSTSYHPQTQGLVERFNSTIVQILKRFVHERQDEWDTYLPMATYAYNTSVQRVNGVTPFEVIFGKKATTPLSELVNETTGELVLADYVHKTRQHMQKIHTLVTKNQNLEQDKEKKRYDQTAAGNCFSVNDKVLLFNPAVKLGGNRKWSPPYQGPFTVIEQTGPSNFKIRSDGDGNNEQIVHQNRLKRYRGGKELATSVQQQVPVEAHEITMDDISDSISSDEDEEMEAIITFQTTTSDRRKSTKEDNQLEIPLTTAHEQPTYNHTENDFTDNPTVSNTQHEEQDEISLQQTMTNDSEHDEDADPLYEPSPLSPTTTARRNPQRTRHTPARYSRQEYDLSAIEILPMTTTRKTSITTRLGLSQYFLLTICCLLMIFNGSVMAFEKHKVNVSQNLAELFGPAHICGDRGKAGHGHYIALPHVPLCEVTDPRGTSVEIVDVTPFFRRMMSDLVDAYACEIETSTIKTYLGFFGTKSILDKTLNYEPFNVQRCREEAAKLEQHTSQLQEIAPHLYSNVTKAFNPTYEWCCKEVIITQRRLRLRKFTIRFNFHTQHLISNMYPVEKCDMNKKSCILSSATVIWDTDVNNTCDVQAGRTVEAEFVEGNDTWAIVSDEGQLALSGTPATESHCRHSLFVSNEGVLVHIRRYGIFESRDKLPMGRGQKHSSSMLSMMAYMGRHLEELTMKLFIQNWYSICKIQSQNYIWLKHLMSNTQTAYLAARMLLQTQNVYAYPAGHVMRVHSCNVINEYYIAPTKACYHTIPVRFGSQNHTGYLVPTTNDIKLLDVAYSCDTIEVEQLLISTNGDTYMWTGQELYSTNFHYTSIELVQHIPRIAHVHLLASNIYDATQDAMDKLGEDTTAMTQTMMAIMRASGTDAVTFDPTVIAHAAAETVINVKGVVTKAIHNMHPFLKWLETIICIIIIVGILIIIIFIITKIKAWRDTTKANEILQRMLATSPDESNTARSQPIADPNYEMISSM
jgi:hypothetical protein